MQRPRKQRTIAAPAAVTGFGYWSGCDVRIEFRPAPAGAGITFVRDDVEPPIGIAAAVGQRIDAPRRTILACQGFQVEMVEHVMAALAGLGIDNCQVWTDAAEMPGCDGSSLAFVEALDAAGSVEFDVERPQLVVDRTIRVAEGDSWIEARCATSSGLSLEYQLDYPSVRAIGHQQLRIQLTPSTFRKELAASRTFMLKEEADQLLAHGLGTRVTPRDLLVFGHCGPLGNELRFRDECVRHKILDLVGDLALAQCDLTADIVAYRSGHRLNANLVVALLDAAALAVPQRRCA
jgi:UDP-3-O-acyl N-acetylglucosamine deacetylase